MADLFENAPSAAATALGAVGDGGDAKGPGTAYHSSEPPRKHLIVRAIGPDGQPFTVLGQMAKVLLALIAAGEAGVDPLARETWSLRLSDHVRKLKTLRGLSIATMWGRHDEGRHARYILQSAVIIVEIVQN